VVGLLVLLSFVLIAAVLFPEATDGYVVGFMSVCLGLWAASVAAGAVWTLRLKPVAPAMSRARRAAWRMPPLAQLPAADLSWGGKAAMRLLWAYLLLAVAMVVMRIVQLALS
jgi:hypothetical protein